MSKKKLKHVSLWINNRECLNVTCIERTAGIPEKTLLQFLLGSRPLPYHHLDRLISVLEKYGYTEDAKVTR